MQNSTHTFSKDESKTNSLVGVFRKEIARFFDRPTTAANLRSSNSSTTSTGVLDVAFGNYDRNFAKLSQTRKAIWRDLEHMDINDELISTGLDIIADCTTGFEPTESDSFEWIFAKEVMPGSKRTSANSSANNGDAMQLLNELFVRLNLGNEAWQITRNFVQHGEEFREAVIDEDGFIQTLRYLPSYQIWPNFDDKGNKIPGWYQKLDNASNTSQIPFDEWQIIPFIYGSNKNYFGTGLMSSARRSWFRLQKLEDGMVMARFMRAYDKLKHRVPVNPNWDLPKQLRAIEDYKKLIGRKKVIASDGSQNYADNPLSVETDFYLPDDGTGRGNIESLHGQNAQLQNLEDILYHREKVLARLKVPRYYLNLGSGNKGALTDGGTSSEDRQFARTLRQTQAVLRRGMLELGALCLFFQGYNSDDLGLQIKMAEVNNDMFLQDSQVKLNLANCALIYSNLFGGLPTSVVVENYMKLNTEDQKALEIFKDFTTPQTELSPVKGVDATNPTPGSKDGRKLTKSSSDSSRTSGSKQSSSPSIEEIVQSLTRLKILSERTTGDIDEKALAKSVEDLVTDELALS